MSYSIKQPKVSAQLGAGLGKGLAEQLPKEIDRYRLKTGLQGLQEKAAGGATGLDLLTQAYTTPGMTPEMAHNLLPYLQSAALAGGSSGQPKGQPGMTPGGDTTPEGHNAIRLLGTEEAINQGGIERHKTNPLLYPTVSEGIAAQDRAYKRQQATLTKISTEFKDALGKTLHKDTTQTYSDVLGDLQLEFQRKAEEDALSGKMTEEEAIDKYRKQALDFAKAKGQLATGWYGSTPSNTLKNIDSIRNTYKQLGRLEDFKNELIANKDLSAKFASELSMPIEDNKGLSKYIKGLGVKSYPKSTNLAGERRGSAPTNEQVADHIIKHLDNEDSLLSIAAELDKRNYDGDAILDELQKRMNDGTWTPSVPQAREFGEQRPLIPTLGDFWLGSLTGRNRLGGKK